MTAVLVVDDEPGMRETLVDILEDAGYDVATAANGDEALATVDTRPFDVVLMDIKMPGRDGVTIMQEMGRPPPHVIMMTGFAIEERLRQAVADAFAVIYKPFQVDRLLGVVATAAGRQ